MHPFKILVLSDSHAGLSFMRMCIAHTSPDAVVHLGDYMEDGRAMAEENPGLPFYLLPGNCDRLRGEWTGQDILTPTMAGAILYMTHGHRHNVKQGIQHLLTDARTSGAAAVLYGHTHRADCHREADGLWVLNPGACGSFGGSAGWMEIENGRISVCRILHTDDLEAMK